MRVKICGITNLEDALWAVEAGADALGFVFYEKSPRYITPKEAAKLTSLLPPFIQCVGLFVNESSEVINSICKDAKMDLAQIISDEGNFDNLDVKYLRVVRAKSKEDILKYQDEYILVDAFVEQFGGAGKRVALEWFEGIDCSKIVLAGGLKEDNLSELKSLGLYGVDVSSGVEAKKGKKDRDKVHNFVRKANEI